MSSTTLQMEEFKALKALLYLGRSWRVRVGIMGNKAERFDIGKTTQDKINNPTLGLVHEKGSKSLNIPRRSFLQQPLEERLPLNLPQIGRQVWRVIILRDGLDKALAILGKIAENIVQGAFDTKGYGKWRPWSPSYARFRARLAAKKLGRPGIIGSILVLSRQLRRGITSKVVKGRP